MAESSQLNELLAQYRTVGELNSEGVFTVDLARALPKLEKFQLPKPHFGLLKVIQSAVASGASRIELHFTATTLSIEHDGEPPSAEQLRTLLDHLMAPDLPVRGRSLRDLAIGVNTTLARGSRWVEVCARQPDGWVRQRWLGRVESEQAEIQPRFAGGSGFNLRFAMRRGFQESASQLFGLGGKSVSSLLTRSRDAMDEDARAIYDRCRYAPVDLRINGRRVPPASFGQRVLKRWSPFHLREHRRPNLVDLLLVSRESSTHLLNAPSGEGAPFRYQVSVEMEQGELKVLPEVTEARGDYGKRCWGWVGIRNCGTVPFQVALIKDGVHLTSMAPKELGLPSGVSATLVAEGLKLDLSQFRLVKGEPLENRLKALGGIVALGASRCLKDGRHDSSQKDLLLALKRC